MFVAPLGPIEADELTWYLERYYRWPIGVFRERAAGVAAQLPGWGEKLYTAAVGQEKAQEVFAAWQHAHARRPAVERRFSVRVDKEALPGVAPEEAAEAATELLALPWELLHDKTGWLFQGGQSVRVRRRLPNRRSQPVRETTRDDPEGWRRRRWRWRPRRRRAAPIPVARAPRAAPTPACFAGQRVLRVCE